LKGYNIKQKRKKRTDIFFIKLDRVKFCGKHWQ
jgi:hypothetical protein